MPGSPVRRAKKLAEARSRAADALGVPLEDVSVRIVGVGLPEAGVPDCGTAEGGAGVYSPTPMRRSAPAQATRDLYSKFLRGADEALDAILSGAAPRDAHSLASVALQLARAARELEPEVGEHDDPAKLAAEARALEEELRRRG